jgi:hypothetical protein
MARGEEMPDAGKCGRVEDELSAEDLRDNIAGEVVAGGAETAGGDDQIRPCQGLAESVLDLPGVVRDTNLAGNFPAQVGKLAAKPLLVGVENTADQEFGAGIDQFNVHEQGRVIVGKGAGKWEWMGGRIQILGWAVSIK